MKLLYFPRHGDGAIEMAILCRGAGIDLDLSGKDNGLCGANTTSADLAGMRDLSVGTPDSLEVQRHLYEGRYDAVVVHRAFQVEQYRASLLPLSSGIPLIVRHSGSELDLLQRLQIRNFFSTSQRALERFHSCNVFLKPKLLDWSRIPSPNFDPKTRRGVSSFVNYYWTWSEAYRKFESLTKIVAPPPTNFGIESPAGVVPDLKTMLKSRATLHLKNGGACCFAVVRSLATGTPVVMDRDTWEKGCFDGVDGILVREDLRGVADELERLQSDDCYWEAASREAYRCARRQFSYHKKIGSGFRRFVTSAQPERGRVNKLLVRRGQPPSIAGTPTSEKQAGRAKPGINERIIDAVIGSHDRVERLLIGTGILGATWRRDSKRSDRS